MASIYPTTIEGLAKAQVWLPLDSGSTISCEPLYDKIDLPLFVNNSDSPAVWDFVQAGEFEDEMLDGSYRHGSLGWRLQVAFRPAYMTADEYRNFDTIMTWVANHPIQPLYLVPHADQAEVIKYKAYLVGKVSKAYPGKQSGYTGSFAFKGSERLPAPILPVTSYATYWVAEFTDYIAGDPVRHWATSGCPWSFGEFRPTDTLEFFWYKNSTGAVGYTVLDGGYRQGMNLPSAEVVRYIAATQTDGIVECMVMLLTAKSVALCWRMNAIGTQFYYLRCDLDNQKLHFGKRAGGVNSDIASFDFVVAAGVWQRLRVVYTGTTMMFYTAAKDSNAWNYLGYANDATFTSGQTGFFAISGSTGLFTDFICADSNGVFLDYDTSDSALLGYWSGEKQRR